MTREEKRATKFNNIPKLFYWIRKIKINDGAGGIKDFYLTEEEMGFAASKNLPNHFSFLKDESNLPNQFSFSNKNLKYPFLKNNFISYFNFSNHPKSI